MIKKIPPEGGSVATVNSNNYFEQVQNIQDQIQDDCQVRLPEILTDGKNHRFSSGDAKPKANNCWYMAKVDIDGVIICHYKNWSTSLSKTAFGCTNAKPKTIAERCALAKRLKLDKKLREKAEKQKQLTVRREAQAIWEQAKKSGFEHQYLTAKQILAWCIRKYKQQLLIPMRDARGVLWNYQKIFPNGKKFYLKDARVLGLFHTVDQPVNTEQCVIRICEGYATGASIYQVTKKPVIVAFSTANLAPVGLAIKKAFPLARIIFCGDDDRFTTTGINAGRVYANKAAEIIQAEVIFPKFPDGCNGTDFNDLINYERANHAKS